MLVEQKGFEPVAGPPISKFDDTIAGTRGLLTRSGGKAEINFESSKRIFWSF